MCIRDSYRDNPEVILRIIPGYDKNTLIEADVYKRQLYGILSMILYPIWLQYFRRRSSCTSKLAPNV